MRDTKNIKQLLFIATLGLMVVAAIIWTSIREPGAPSEPDARGDSANEQRAVQSTTYTPVASQADAPVYTSETADAEPASPRAPKADEDETEEGAAEQDGAQQGESEPKRYEDSRPLKTGGPDTIDCGLAEPSQAAFHLPGAIQFSPDERWLVATSRGDYVGAPYESGPFVWDLESGELAWSSCSEFRVSGTPLAIDIGPRSKRVFTIGTGFDPPGTLRAKLDVRDIASGRRLHSLDIDEDWLAMRAIADGKRAVLAYSARALKVEPNATGVMLHFVEVGSGQIRSKYHITRADLGADPDAGLLKTEISEDGRFIAVAVGTYVGVWRLSDRQRIFRTEVDEGPIYRLTFSPDETRLAAFSKSIDIYDLDKGKPVSHTAPCQHAKPADGEEATKWQRQLRYACQPGAQIRYPHVASEVIWRDEETPLPVLYMLEPARPITAETRWETEATPLDLERLEIISPYNPYRAGDDLPPSGTQGLAIGQSPTGHRVAYGSACQPQKTLNGSHGFIALMSPDGTSLTQVLDDGVTDQIQDNMGCSQ